VPDVFDHVTIRVSDLEASRRFYELALAQLGYGEPYRGDHFFEWEDLSISTAREDKPATRSLHLALLARFLARRGRLLVGGHDRRRPSRRRRARPAPDAKGSICARAMPRQRPH
jgi:catechol 2,3-dioxygenase-like lactoylglutathione lyase family enzyme